MSSRKPACQRTAKRPQTRDRTTGNRRRKGQDHVAGSTARVAVARYMEALRKGVTLSE